MAAERAKARKRRATLDSRRQRAKGPEPVDAVAVVNAELLTVKETAKLLRTTPKGVYTMIERGRLPGVVRLGRRVLVRSADLRKHLGLPPVECAPDPKGKP